MGPLEHIYILLLLYCKYELKLRTKEWDNQNRCTFSYLWFHKVTNNSYRITTYDGLQGSCAQACSIDGISQLIAYGWLINNNLMCSSLKPQGTGLPPLSVTHCNVLSRLVAVFTRICSIVPWTAPSLIALISSILIGHITFTSWAGIARRNTFRFFFGLNLIKVSS